MREPNQPRKEDLRLSTVLYGFNDPIRIKIVKDIHRYSEQSCCGCLSSLQVPKSTLSHHVKVLRESGIISRRVEGKYHYYSIRHDDLNEKFPGLVNAILTTDDEHL